MNEREPLYGKCDVDPEVLEALRDADRLKYDKMLQFVTPCKRLVDIGCGWGQFLGLVQDHAEELWAVDESPDRVPDIQRACPKAKMVVCRADCLELPTEYFDIAVTSQMLHEVVLFGRKGELEKTLSEIHRVIAVGGRWLLQDHGDAGDGDVVVHLPDEQMENLVEFERKFQFYKAEHQPAGHGNIRIPKRCLQDFLTKDMWLNTSLESLEMRETHNVFQDQQIVDMALSAGFSVRECICFTDIKIDLDRHGAKLIEGETWSRKLLLVAEKT
jgi:Methyltransferase domain